jgi:hypothetical protein
MVVLVGEQEIGPGRYLEAEVGSLYRSHSTMDIDQQMYTKVRRERA